MEQTLPKILKRVVANHPDIAAQYAKNASGDFEKITFMEYFQTALDFGAGLLSIGIKRGDHIGLISDNRKEWAHADMGLLIIGAIDIPRGCDASERDLRYILSFSECQICIVENNTQLQKILAITDDAPLLKKLIIFDKPENTEIELVKSKQLELYTFADLLKRGKDSRNEKPGLVEEELEKGNRDDIATIIFTSGTTGEPKGVMLSHGNFITQLDELPERILLSPGDKAMCVLPIWHSFERLCEYVILNAAATVCYSKPIASALLPDFQKINPQIIPAVPRVFEAIYDGVFRTMRKTGGITLALFTFFVNVSLLFNKIDRRIGNKEARFKKENRFLYALALGWLWLLLYPFKALGSVLVFKKIRAKLGTAFRGGISGGGALPPSVDEFFWAIGIKIVEGYGLTETAPVVAVRPFTRPIFGTVGSPIRGVEVRITDDDGTILAPGKKGSVQVRGGIIMKGYYRRPELTAQVLSSDGWLDTGDIGMLTLDGELVLRGRKKDTIVLRGGENIEPLPLEMRLNESRYITQTVVLGQDENGMDQRFLAALIVPMQDEVTAYAQANGISYSNYTDLLQNPEIKKLFDLELRSHINVKNGFKPFELINRFELLSKAFEVGVELSAKQEIMRYKMKDLYPDQIHRLFK